MTIKIIGCSLESGSTAGSKGLFDISIKRIENAGPGTAGSKGLFDVNIKRIENVPPGTAGSKGLFDKTIKQTSGELDHNSPQVQQAVKGYLK